MIEHYKNDLLTLTKQADISFNGRGVTVCIECQSTKKGINTAQENSYITQTLVQFIKTSGSAPVFVYFTLHYEHQGRYLDDNPDVFTRKVLLNSCVWSRWDNWAQEALSIVLKQNSHV